MFGRARLNQPGGDREMYLAVGLLVSSLFPLFTFCVYLRSWNQLSAFYDGNKRDVKHVILSEKHQNVPNNM